MKINVRFGNKRHVRAVEIEPTAKVIDLKREILKLRKSRSKDTDKQRLSLRNKNSIIYLADNYSLSSYGLCDNGVVYSDLNVVYVDILTAFLIWSFVPILFNLFLFAQDISKAKLQGMPMGPLSVFQLAFEGLRKTRNIHHWIAFFLWNIYHIESVMEVTVVSILLKRKRKVRARRLFANCSIYWPFTYVISYSINNPEFHPRSTILEGAGIAVCALSLFFMLLFTFQRIKAKIRGQITNSDVSLPGEQHPVSDPKSKALILLQAPSFLLDIIYWIGYAMVTGTMSSIIFISIGAAHVGISQYYRLYLRRRKYMNN